jgi:hypothetical protein
MCSEWRLTICLSSPQIMDVAVGAIQDKHVDAGVNQYDEVFYLLIALKAVDVIYGLGYDW